MPRSAVVGALVAAATAVGWWRRRGRPVVDLRYADGSALALEAGTQTADDLLALTRRALRVAGDA